jgi:hypothetical protein
MTTILVIVAGNSWIGGKSFEALNLGGSSSSHCRGMVMTLLAVDKVFLYFSFDNSGFCEHQRWMTAVSSGMVYFS